MKSRVFNWTRITLAALCLMGFSSLSADLKVGFVNFRKCIEESKMGKQQQSAFEGLQGQMEASLGEIQKNLAEITNKLSDEDYLDGLSTDAENELKHKYRTLSQELARTQGQYVQTLQDANVRVLQMLSNEVTEAAQEVAKAKGLDLVFNEEACFYYKPSMDISTDIVAALDGKFEKEQKANPAQKPPVPANNNPKK